jgi:hypothetical protein
LSKESAALFILETLEMKLDMVVHTYNPALKSLGQEDCESLATWATCQDSVKKKKKQQIRNNSFSLIIRNWQMLENKGRPTWL